MPKIILITGGTGLVGTALVEHFLAKGFKVITTRKGQEKKGGHETITTTRNGNLTTIMLDFFEEESLDFILETLKERNIQPNYLINNARDKSTLSVGENHFVSEKNFTNEHYIQVVFPYTLAHRIIHECGDRLESIINVGSQYGVSAVPPSMRALEGATPIHYSVTKAAIIHLTKEMAILWAKHDVTVNCISLGGIDSGNVSKLTETYANLSPIGRMLSVNETIEAFDFLLSDGAKAITGHNLLIDGGWTII